MLLTAVVLFIAMAGVLLIAPHLEVGRKKLYGAALLLLMVGGGTVGKGRFGHSRRIR